jgi:AcrR family transcriptional regulator
MGSSRKGIPKGDKRARTRARLIEAAGELIGERGYEGISLEEVAVRAGMSRGAIYGNFVDREELLLTVVENHWQPSLPPPLEPGASLRSQLRIIGKAVAEAADARRASAVGALSFQIYLLRHESMRKRFAAANAALYAAIEAHLQRFLPADELPMPPARFIRILHALADGLTFARFLEPDQFTDELIVAAFEALAP